LMLGLWMVQKNYLNQRITHSYWCHGDITDGMQLGKYEGDNLYCQDVHTKLHAKSISSSKTYQGANTKLMIIPETL
jgi:hypothetical protein